MLKKVENQEIWKDIPGYEEKYQASNLGKVRSLPYEVNGRNYISGKVFRRKIKGQVLKPGRFCKSEHLSVVLGHGTNGKPVHQLVALTFLEPLPKGREVLHKNGNPTNNRVENLRYGTRRDNILDVLYQGKAWRKLTIEDVHQIRFGLATGIKGAELAKMYNISQQEISKIKRGRTFSWLK